MMRHYRNKKTGQVIKTTGKVTGLNWERLVDTNDEETVVDDTNDEETVVEDIPDEETVVEDIPDEDPDAEQTPVQKPKTSRRGKK